MKHKGNNLVPKVIVSALIILILVTIYSKTNQIDLFNNLKSQIFSSNSSISDLSKDQDDQNEDQLSQYKIPDNVLLALNEARSSQNPVLGIRADGPSYHIPILMYHYVEHVQDRNDKIRISLDTLPEVLDQQIQTLVQANYNFITPSDLADILDGIKKIPANPVMLSFDDGYRDFYTDAFPILKKYNVKSVAYVISGFIDKPNNLTSSQLQEIAASGLVEIGAHTVHHLALSGLPESLVISEIDSSRVQLEQRLGIPITAFAYPYGSFDISTIKVVREAGFRTAVSTVPGVSVSNSDRFFVERLRPGSRTGESLLSLVQSSK